MWFPRQEYWSGLPFHSPGHLPDPEIGPSSPALQADVLLSEPPGKPKVNFTLKWLKCWKLLFHTLCSYFPLAHILSTSLASGSLHHCTFMPVCSWVLICFIWLHNPARASMEIQGLDFCHQALNPKHYLQWRKGTISEIPTPAVVSITGQPPTPMITNPGIDHLFFNQQ